MFQRIMLKIPIISMMVFSIIVGDMKINIQTPTVSPQMTSYTEHQQKTTRSVHDSGKQEVHDINSQSLEKKEQVKMDLTKNFASVFQNVKRNEAVHVEESKNLDSKSQGNEPNQHHVMDQTKNLELKSDVVDPNQHQVKEDQIQKSEVKPHSLDLQSQHQAEEDEIQSPGVQMIGPTSQHSAELDESRRSTLDSKTIESIQSLEMSQSQNLSNESPQGCEPVGFVEKDSIHNFESNTHVVDQQQKQVETNQILDPETTQTLNPSQDVKVDPIQSSDSESMNIESTDSVDRVTQTLNPSQDVKVDPIQSSDSESMNIESTDSVDRVEVVSNELVSNADNAIQTRELETSQPQNLDSESHSIEPTESVEVNQTPSLNSDFPNTESTETPEVDQSQNSDFQNQITDPTERLEVDETLRQESDTIEATKIVEVDQMQDLAYDSSARKDNEKTIYTEISEGYESPENDLHQRSEFSDHHNLFLDPVQNEVDEKNVDSALVEKHEHPRVNPLLEHAHQHLHQHQHECKKNQKEMDDDHDYETEENIEYSFKSSFILAMRHLSSSLIGFLPEHLQDTILDVNDALVFTGIMALALISICVPYFFIEAYLAVRPLKKKVTDLNKALWKVSTAYDNQQEEYDAYKQKALAYDEDKKQIEELELQLHLVKQIELKLKEENRSLKKRLNADAKAAGELEGFIATTMTDHNQIMEERDKLKAIVMSLQTKLKEKIEELESLEAEAGNTQMDLELLTHTNENLDLRGKALEREIVELKTKFHIEIDLRRELQTENDALVSEKIFIQEQLVDLKSVLHKYEQTVNNLNDEISTKENELLALKETLGEDSPLVDIAEVTGRLKMAEGQATTLQSRIESITLENSSLTRDYDKAKVTLKTLQSEKDQAETRLQVLEAYFKEKEEELRRVVEKHETEKEIRGKDKDELILIIEEKSDEVRDLTQRLTKLKEEFEETKLAHRNENRALEAKGHETWLSLCQSERKAQDVRKEAELLRQKLTAITKAKELDGIDALSSNGEVPYTFSQLDLEEVPLPMLLPDEPIRPSYFGLDDFEPPAPLDDDDDDDEVMESLHSRRNPHEPQRPPPLGRISPTYSDQEEEDERELSPIRGMGIRTERRDEFSDGSSSPPPPQGHGGLRENYMNGSMHPRRRQPLNTSSPLQHGLNL